MDLLLMVLAMLPTVPQGISMISLNLVTPLRSTPQLTSTKVLEELEASLMILRILFSESLAMLMSSAISRLETTT